MATEISQAPLVGVVMGSKSDWETMRHASELLTELEVFLMRVEGGLGSSGRF